MPSGQRIRTSKKLGDQNRITRMYLVLPFALVIAWVRRDLFPGLTQEADFRAFILVGVGCFLRVLSALSFFEFADDTQFDSGGQ